MKLPALPTFGLQLSARRLCAQMLLSCLIMAGCSMAALPALAEILKIGGTGADLGTMRLLGEAFTEKHPDIAVKLVPQENASSGIVAVLKTDINLAISTRPLTVQELSDGANSKPYARTALVFANHIDQPRNRITTQELAGIYEGRLKTWADGSQIRLILRPQNDADTALLAKKLPAFGAALKNAYDDPGNPIAGTDQDAATRIERLTGAMGTLSLSVILSEKRALKPLTLNGVTPNAASIADGSYPITKTFYFITANRAADDPGNANANTFMKFVQSKDGRTILGSTGHQVLH